MNWRCFLGAVFVCAACLRGQSSTISVGEGAPNDSVAQTFVNAWFRNGFSGLVGDPLGTVSKFGSTGLVQQFPLASNRNLTLGLVKPDETANYNVMQVRVPVFAYYSSVGVVNAGYPKTDTLGCPAPPSSGGVALICQWQEFTNGYALFVYSTATYGNVQSYATRSGFYTKWAALGGISALGAANSAETSITTRYTTQATLQSYATGAIYTIASGNLNGRVLAVKGPIYALYSSLSAHAGALGAPTSEELVVAGGKVRQSFEGGSIDYDPATGVAVQRPPVASVVLTPSGTARLNLGDTINATAATIGDDGTLLPDRTIAWNTSNGRVVQIQANGTTAVLKAVGAGTAVITLSTEGKTSASLTITVVAPCCQIGEGAPTAAIQQAFRDAVTRNKLSVQLPAGSGATRAGNGYVQPLVSTAQPPVAYLITVADDSVTGYVVAGAIAARYVAAGGAAGALGYAVMDATSGGRQAFQGGTLAGNPVQVVGGSILAKWRTLGYETGSLGSPNGPAAPFQTFRASSGSAQPFDKGVIYSGTSGPLADQTFAVTGPILAAYLSSGGPGGDLGAPTVDERVVGGLRQQDFEGGYISYPPAGSVATLVRTPRQPVLTATPATVLSGSAVHLALGGFANGATLRVSQTGQPDFVVRVPAGSYSWDVWVPPSATAGTVTVRAVDTAANMSAQGLYTIRGSVNAAAVLSIVSGDRQTGAPGALLSQPLIVAVQDADGNPLPGRPVSFAGSPGAQVVPAAATTDSNGQASARLRLPAAAGISLATAQSGTRVVTFSARSAAVSLTNFPVMSQDVAGTLGNGSDTIRQKGALLTSIAATLRYYQTRNEVGQPNGLSSPLTLNQFLTGFCATDAQGGRICDGFVSLGTGGEQTVNLWRLGAFTGGGLDVRVEQPTLENVRDLVVGGSPVLLALSLNGMGSHFVVATGVSASGSIDIADPNPAFGQTSLDTYLNGFASGGGTVKGTLTGAVRLVPQAPTLSGFVVAANTPVTISGVAGVCGQTLQFPSLAAVAGIASARQLGVLSFVACDGSNETYQIDLGTQGGFTAVLTSLAANGGRAALDGPSALAVRSGADWVVAPAAASIRAGGVVNAASFGPEVSPGGLISIFGAGFVRAGSATTVTVNGEPAPVVAAFPFQVNAQVPVTANPGPAVVRVTTAGGSAEQAITLSDVSPAIFELGNGQAAMTNQDNSLNTRSNPAQRGRAIVIYGTGLGAVSRAGALSNAVAPVSVIIGEAEVAAAFAGLTPGAIGLYQVNVVVPAALPPGLALPLYLRQAGAVSNSVAVAVQ